MREFFSGVTLLARGFGWWRRRPATMALGLIPAALVGLVLLAALVALAWNLPALTQAVTPFAEDWPGLWATVIRLAAGTAMLGASLVLVAVSFTALTLVVGEPFYDRIWRAVERDCARAASAASPAHPRESPQNAPSGAPGGHSLASGAHASPPHPDESPDNVASGASSRHSLATRGQDRPTGEQGGADAGGVPDAGYGFWRGVGDAVSLVARGVLIAVVAGLLGFIPVVGGVIATVTGVTATGWLLADELSSRALTARGMDRATRRTLLRAHRARALGFGFATQLCFLVPLGAVATMPAAVAGSTLLARSLVADQPPAQDPGGGRLP
ncbi:EI24 domain-containing protein [Microbacterium sp. LRZ72]|uniref:EI24 domain-containing protein n=1 Tax=Microbacterium sp. LRZ72 TaxID=2942481 RepID=UPI0029BBF149|nr:EI24 domain-containing protein [Microbacterium sp. LRZ72]MDX2375884.1 EI24 domain-containing protein [Microbacterium sp. LRZ72]